MTTWSRSEVTETTVNYTVPATEPWGATWAEIYQAISAALEEIRGGGGGIPSDDAIRVHAVDEAIVVSFTKRET